jgi:gluconate 2-dehydrogenase gamma chain
MNEDSRRAFLSRLLATSGAVMTFGTLPDFSLAHEHAVAQLHAGENKFAFFTPEDARQMEAVCEQIIPSDDGPGAREAGAIYFIDYALSQTEPDLQPVFRAGLKELAAACAPDKFTELGVTRQIAVLKKLERTEFFERARQYTILGFLGNPTRHGNRDQVGWKYIGFENPGFRGFCPVENPELRKPLAVLLLLRSLLSLYSFLLFSFFSKSLGFSSGNKSVVTERSDTVIIQGLSPAFLR